jgi:hypothetical protein
VSRSTRIFGLIEKEMPGFVLCKDMLVIPPTEHILRGFLIEGTSQKGRIYLWKVVCPLHRPMRDPFLNYSSRITKKNHDIYVDPKDYKTSAALIGSIISEHVDDLASIRTPKDFLRHISWVARSDNSTQMLDLALTYCRLGNIRKCSDLLKDIRVRFDSWMQELNQMFPKSKREPSDPFDDELKLVERTIEAGPAELIALMDEWEGRNFEQLELGPTRVLPVARTA